MRTRQTTDETSNAVLYWARQYGGSYSNTETRMVGSSQSTSQVTTDVQTPDFYSRRAKGEIIMNDFESCRSKMDAFAPSLHYDFEYFTRPNSSSAWVKHPSSTDVYTTGPYNGRAGYPRTPMALMSTASRNAELANFGYNPASVSEQQLLLAAALDKAAQPEVMSLVSVAEMDKTIALFGSAARILNKAVTQLERLGPTGLRDLNALLSEVSKMRPDQRRGLLKTLRKGLNRRTLGKGVAAVFSAWLGYRYAIMTTFYDIRSWAGAMGSAPRRTRHVAQRSYDWSSDTGEVLNLSDLYRDRYYRTVRKRRTQITAGVLVSAEAFDNADRFGANRILSSAWELVPFSFVIDWFVDIGTRLSALEGGLSVRPLGSWVTTDHSLLYSFTYRNDHKTTIIGDQKWVGSGENSGSVTELTQWKVRDVEPILSLFPRIRVKLNTARLIDGLALMIQGRHRLWRAIKL